MLVVQIDVVDAEFVERRIELLKSADDIALGNVYPPPAGRMNSLGDVAATSRFSVLDNETELCCERWRSGCRYRGDFITNIIIIGKFSVFDNNVDVIIADSTLF